MLVNYSSQENISEAFFGKHIHSIPSQFSALATSGKAPAAIDRGLLPSIQKSCITPMRRQEQLHRLRSRADAAGCGQTEYGPDPLAADKEAVAHGLNMLGKIALCRQHVLLQGLLDKLPLLLKIGFDIKHFFSCASAACCCQEPNDLFSVLSSNQFFQAATSKKAPAAMGRSFSWSRQRNAPLSVQLSSRCSTPSKLRPVPCSSPSSM